MYIFLVLQTQLVAFHSIFSTKWRSSSSLLPIAGAVSNVVTIWTTCSRQRTISLTFSCPFHQLWCSKIWTRTSRHYPWRRSLYTSALDVCFTTVEYFVLFSFTTKYIRLPSISSLWKTGLKALWSISLVNSVYLMQLCIVHEYVLI